MRLTSPFFFMTVFSNAVAAFFVGIIKPPRERTACRRLASARPKSLFRTLRNHRNSGKDVFIVFNKKLSRVNHLLFVVVAALSGAVQKKKNRITLFGVKILRVNYLIRES